MLSPRTFCSTPAPSRNRGGAISITRTPRLSMCLLLVAVLLSSIALAGPAEADARVDHITVQLAASLNRGDIDEPTYTLLFDLRTLAHRAVTRWLHGGPAFAPAARSALAHLEDALR